MFAQFQDAHCLFALKWKQGEARAVGTVNRQMKKDMLILFDVPPAGDYDHELDRPLEPTEHIKLFGPRLEKSCRNQAVFVDARLVDDARHREGLAHHPLTELIERGRLAGARPCPVTGLGRGSEYQAAVAGFVDRHGPLPICLRLSGADFENPSLNEELFRLLEELGCEPERVFLIVDFGASRLSEEDVGPFTELLIARLNELPMLHRWLNLAVLMTSFPEAIKLKAGQSERYPRVEWIAYQGLWNARDRLLRMPIYGDYAVEYPGRYVTGQAIPVAQSRYTTKRDILVHKGLSTKKPNGYEVIREVAARLVGEPEFMGADYSAGDAFMGRLASSVGGPGNASTWRWAWTDHHISMAWRGLRALLGLSADVSEPKGDPVEVQDQLF